MFLCGHDSYQSSWHMFWTKNRIYFYTRGIFVIIELSHNFVCSFHRSLHLDMGNGSIFTVIHLRFIGQCSRFLNNNDLHQALVLGVGSGSTGRFNMSLDHMGSNFSWVTQGWILLAWVTFINQLQRCLERMPPKRRMRRDLEMAIRGQRIFVRDWSVSRLNQAFPTSYPSIKDHPNRDPGSITSLISCITTARSWRGETVIFVFSHVFSPPLAHIDMWTCALDISSTAHRPFDQGQKGSLGGGGLKSPPEMLTKPRPKSCNDQYTIIHLLSLPLPFSDLLGMCEHCMHLDN